MRTPPSDEAPDVSSLLERARGLGFEATINDNMRLKLDNGFASVEAPRTASGLRTLHRHLDDWAPGGRMWTIPSSIF